MPYDIDCWVVVRIRLHGPYIVLSCRDDLGARAQATLHSSFLSFPPGAWAQAPAPALPPQSIGSPAFDHTRIVDIVARALLRRPEAKPGSTARPPLAVYLDVPQGLEALDFESFLTPLIAPAGAPLQTVRLTRGRWVRRRGFRLPLRVAAIGDLAATSIHALMTAQWMELQGASTHGVLFEFLSATSAIAEMSRRERFDVLIVESPDFLTDLGDVPLLNRPRLIVLLAASRPVSPKPEGGTALLLVPTADSYPAAVSSFLTSFYYGIVHDQPLHEALRSAGAEFSPGPKPLLFSDPAANQYLRLMDAAAAIRRETIRLEGAYRPGGLAEFLQRAGATRGWIDTIVPLSQEVVTVVAPVAKIASEGRNASRDFSAETRGLVPLAQMEAQLAEIRKAIPGIDKRMRELASDQQLFALLREHQQRSVDVALERVESWPPLESVERSTTLAAGVAYRVRVHIGQRLQDSIVAGPVPPIDPLLLDPDDVKGHKLQVAVQGKDFRVLSRQVRTLYLPFVGGSEPVYFKIRAPRQTGHAQLRILVYHRNHVVQTFVLEAEIAEDERTHPDGLAVKLEFTRTNRFENLDELKPRALSIAINVGAGTHQVTIKSQKAFGEVRLPIEAVDNDLQEFRKVLDLAMRDPSNADLERNWPRQSASMITSGDLADVLRGLADRGTDLYHGLFARASLSDPSLRKGLVQIKKLWNESLQILRMDFGFVFPWTFLYDYDLPDQGAESAPVCLGTVTDSSGQTVPCAHTSTSGVYCVNGFWGIRHYIEEFLASGNAADVPVSRQTSTSAIRIVADAAIPESNGLITSLQEKIGVPQVTAGPLDDEALIALLWKTPPERPVILIVLGHMAADERIVLVENQAWLSHKSIAKRAGNEEKGWAQPRSIVLLMACESANTTSQTINSFLTALQTAGAAGIVGTEAIVGSSLASEFAKEVTLALWSRQKTLGQAMTDFRRRVVRAGNPLGFVFNSIGEIDLTVQCS